MRRICIFPALAFGLLLAAPALKAQTSSPAIDPAINALAQRLAETLHKAHAKRVAIFDLLGPQREVHPVGKWLADQFAIALHGSLGEIQIIDRDQLRATMKATEDPDSDEAVRQMHVRIARGAHADAFIAGTYAQLAGRLGITLSPERLSHLGPQSICGVVPISPVVASLSQDPIPAITGEFPKAGVAGTSIPTCIHCPDPGYSDRARNAHLEGTVVLQVIVTAQGTVQTVIPLKGPGSGLEEQAVEAVRKWVLKPAVDVDGHPVAVVVPVEVTFRLLHRF